MLWNMFWLNARNVVNQNLIIHSVCQKPWRKYHIFILLSENIQMFFLHIKARRERKPPTVFLECESVQPMLFYKANNGSRRWSGTPPACNFFFVSDISWANRQKHLLIRFRNPANGYALAHQRITPPPGFRWLSASPSSSKQLSLYHSFTNMVVYLRFGHG